MHGIMHKNMVSKILRNFYVNKELILVFKSLKRRKEAMIAWMMIIENRYY